jgi:tripartite-type tricarboxylate transporter receptor subunit TctC
MLAALAWPALQSTPPIAMHRLLQRNIHALCVLCLCLGFAQGGAAYAQGTYPERQIRMIVPFPAGGPTDVMGRVVAEVLAQRMGQPVVVENHAGAGGSIGADMVAKAAPDGYTLMVTSAGVVTVNPSLSKVPFDTMRDFAPVVRAATLPSIMVVPPMLNVKTVAELITLAKSRPGELNYGTAGPGSASHLAMESFNRIAGTRIMHVPYKGAAPAVTDLLGGNVQVMLIGMSTVIPFVRAGRLVPLAVSSPTPSPLAPEIPTIAATLPGFEVGDWFGLFAPARTPRAIIDRLNAEVNAGMQNAALKQRIGKDAFEGVPANTPAQFRSFVQGEIARWSKVVKDAGLAATN